MRIEEREFDVFIKETLASQPRVPADLESALFEAAEGLLGERRKRVTSREAGALLVQKQKTRRIEWFRELKSKAIEVLAFHPQMAATAATFMALALSFFSLRSNGGDGYRISYADLPAIPKTNDFPALYDSNYHAERMAYEREVENAHWNTSGGI